MKNFHLSSKICFYSYLALYKVSDNNPNLSVHIIGVEIVLFIYYNNKNLLDNESVPNFKGLISLTQIVYERQLELNSIKIKINFLLLIWQTQETSLNNNRKDMLQ